MKILASLLVMLALIVVSLGGATAQQRAPGSTCTGLEAGMVCVDPALVRAASASAGDQQSKCLGLFLCAASSIEPTAPEQAHVAARTDLPEGFIPPYPQRPPRS